MPMPCESDWNQISNPIVGPIYEGYTRHSKSSSMPIVKISKSSQQEWSHELEKFSKMCLYQITKGIIS